MRLIRHCATYLRLEFSFCAFFLFLTRSQVPHNGWAAVRVRVTHAGAWLFHCHISSHHMAGMGFIVLVDPDSAPPPPPGFPTQCHPYPMQSKWPV
jgi:hypothetical protein